MACPNPYFGGRGVWLTESEVKFEKFLSRKRKESFKCRICGQECENLIELKNHKKEHESVLPKFKCDNSFLKEKQLKEHTNQKHKTHPCKECEKVFDWEVNIENHIKAVHEDFKICCHYFNNNKEWGRMYIYIFIKIQKIVGLLVNVKDRCVCSSMKKLMIMKLITKKK